MQKRESTYVYLKDGARGVIERWHTGESGEARALVRVGEARVWVPMSALAHRGDGHYALPLARSQLGAGAAVIPVVAEEISVGRKVVETGVVRVRKSVREREETVTPTVTRETVEVDRVAVGRYVDGPEAPRQEGDTLVVPVFEEVLVVEKRLVLKEEIRITRRRVSETAAPQRVTLRSEEIVVERDAAKKGESRDHT
jgi:uncharacterized protein (TIGR02271 family)